MDIHRSHGTNHVQAQERYREAMVELVRRTRSRVHEAREDAVRRSAEQAAARRVESDERVDVESGRAAENARKDRVDISENLRAQVQNARLDETDEAVRPKIERLQHAVRSGTLNTPERIERAAENLLRNAETPEVRDRALDKAQDLHQAYRAHHARRAAGEATDPGNAG